jgi:hypothetical protein
MYVHLYVIMVHFRRHGIDIHHGNALPLPLRIGIEGNINVLNKVTGLRHSGSLISAQAACTNVRY